VCLQNVSQNRRLSMRMLIIYFMQPVQENMFYKPHALVKISTVITQIIKSLIHSKCDNYSNKRVKSDTKLNFSCRKLTALKESSGPPTDHLLRFLLHTSSDVHPTCANCDNKNRVAMYYCNTCGKLLLIVI
jgi:hypothetical protein